MILSHPRSKRAGGRQGSAVLILLILLGIAAVLTVCNQMTLRRLFGELSLLEKRQQQKYSLRAATNVVEQLRQNPTNTVATPATVSPAANLNPSDGQTAR